MRRYTRCRAINSDSYMNFGITAPPYCPICRSLSDPLLLSAHCFIETGSQHSIFITYFCTACHKAFITHYSSANTTKPLIAAPLLPRKVNFDPVISSISPVFCSIYSEAKQAEFHGLDNIAGMGYRKALEFLVKDFLKHIDPDSSEHYTTMSLSQCISKVENQLLRELLYKASLLGNDNVHYSIKFPEYGLKSLVDLIDSCISLIVADAVNVKTDISKR